MGLKKVIANPKFYVILAIGRILPRNEWGDKIFLKLLYKNRMKRALNLETPKFYNEKLQWIKLFDRNPRYTGLVDKYEVKNIVTNLIGADYVIPTLGVWDRFEDIDFKSLPQKFVLKCTHDSGGIVVCKDKDSLNLEEVKQIINHSLKRDYYLNTREWPYKEVKHRIIAEQYISGADGGIPVDYKFFCFDGEPDCVMLCVGREYGHPKFYFYDMEWKRKLYQKPDIEPSIEDTMMKPDNFDEMVEIVKKLAKGFAEVRVDLYNVDGVIYFGEYTFFNQSGLDVEISEDTDMYWGSKTILHK